ncbi:formyl-CoA transferase [Sulfobacillus thermosulfidooxidans DSM 9293]|uniref:Formyl-CoA transferase n=2 Tax=Sulfobacillus thermosulfidooxidans TaxID=28034 RepID=A0A1W1WBJ5_SULTA|nr:CoA transferase [Sulfobacillus thermosulfidooxidans]PSR24674.1 MAG: CoA transferase [Sulfobacillus thermosulfidooxidans]SMC03681.1 formyl-CoA transferase [Sulfobacillus thermosulfidooxidans DSM 9293]
MDTMSLQGIRVLEIGQLVAAPSAARILADFGADVIKVEPLDGDPLRHWGAMSPLGHSWWWSMQSRNKRLIAVNLKHPTGQHIIRELAKQSDVLIANLRPGRLAQWELGYEHLHSLNPKLIYVDISGFGLTGPYRDRPGFGNIAEAMGGIRYITGFPDRPPVRTGVSLGDELAALYAVIGILIALVQRGRDGLGEHIDVSLVESVLAITEALIPDYVNAGIIQERTGNQLLRAAPSNTYPTRDQQWIAIGANSSATFEALTTVMQQPQLVNDPRFSSNEQRVRHATELDTLIAAWTIEHDLSDLMQRLLQAGIPAGPVMSARDIAEDVQIQFRQMIAYAPQDNGEPTGMLGIVPKLTRHPGKVRWAGGSIGQHTEDVLTTLLHISPTELAVWREQGIIR